MLPKTDRLAWIVAFSIAAILFLGVFVFRPYWGLMDDATLLFVHVRKIEKLGFFPFIWEYARLDLLGWGMFRPTFPIMAYLLYKPGEIFGPLATFFLNTALSLFAITYCSRVLTRITEASFPFTLLGAAAIFYQYDLFQHPSLQEKMLLLSGAFLVRLAWGPQIKNKFVHGALFAFTFLFAFLVKASFMIFFSMAFWAFLAAKKHGLLEEKKLTTWVSLLGFALLGLGSLFFFKYISSVGAYTQRYSVEKVLPNIFSKEGAMFGLPLLLFFFWVARQPRLFWNRPEKLTAFWGVAAFLAVFLPWGIQAYIQTIIGPAFACVGVQLAEGLFARVPARLWQIPLMALALATAAYRVPTMYLRLHDIGAAVAAAPEWEKRGVQKIFLPCDEGTSAMQQYVRDLAGTKIGVEQLSDFKNLEGKAVFFDLALCPLPDRARELPGCTEQEILFEGSLNKSFRLVRGLSCGQ